MSVDDFPPEADLPDTSPIPDDVSLSSRFNWRRTALWFFGIVFVVYMVAMPVGDWIYQRMNPPKTGRVSEDMSVAEQARVRSAEAMTALCFFAVGAAVGSFLNVVVYRLPRGESVAFRRSRCPQCGSRIEGRDNMPIIGWLRLRGKCRACQGNISPRYPIVESTMAGLFLLLYFVELISGGANIPIRRPNFHHGVVWIIFYTKWDLVGLYLYHCFVCFALLAGVLIDIDRGRVPMRARWFLGVALLLPVLIWPELLPVPFWAGNTSWLQSPRMMSAVSCLAGGAFGAALGWLTEWGIESTRASVGQFEKRGRIAGCLAIVGMSLGWQASVAVILCTLLILVATASVARWQRWSLPRLPTIFMAAFVIHHILWRWTIEHWSSWWPSHRTSAVGWIAIVVAYAVLLWANRLVIRQWWRDAEQHAQGADELQAELDPALSYIAGSPDLASEQKDSL